MLKEKIDPGLFIIFAKDAKDRPIADLIAAMPDMTEIVECILVQVNECQ